MKNTKVAAVGEAPAQGKAAPQNYRVAAVGEAPAQGKAAPQNYRVAAIGEALIDFAMTGTGTDGYPVMSAHPGGAPANFLAALSRYGVETEFIGKVGRDAFGLMLKKTLEDNGIGTEGMILDEEVFTTLAFVSIDENGERSFSFSRKPGADTCLREDEISYDIIDSCQILHLGTLSLTDEPARSATLKAAAYAKSRGLLISCDPNLRKPLWKGEELARQAMMTVMELADIIKISDDEVDFIFGDAKPEEGIRLLMERFAPKALFVTCGASGCYYANRNCIGKVAAMQFGKEGAGTTGGPTMCAAGEPTGAQSSGPADTKAAAVVDTTGAGDIFGGAALSGIIRSGKAPEDLSAEEMESIAGFASIAAGISVTRAGGISSIPDIDEVLQF